MIFKTKKKGSAGSRHVAYKVATDSVNENFNQLGTYSNGALDQSIKGVKQNCQEGMSDLTRQIQYNGQQAIQCGGNSIPFTRRVANAQSDLSEFFTLNVCKWW